MRGNWQRKTERQGDRERERGTGHRRMYRNIDGKTVKEREGERERDIDWRLRGRGKRR